MPEKAPGSVIGKGGETMKHTEQSYGIAMKFSDSKHAPREHSRAHDNVT